MEETNKGIEIYSNHQIIVHCDMSPYVLVHGSCLRGRCWKKVSPQLSEDDHNVYTPTLMA
jgi:hypothetical protein